jgi:hypothetical protein
MFQRGLGFGGGMSEVADAFRVRVMGGNTQFEDIMVDEVDMRQQANIQRSLIMRPPTNNPRQAQPNLRPRI